MDLNKLIAAVDESGLGVLNVVVRQAGNIIAEHDFAEERRVLVWSVSKTFTAMAIGIAEAEGFLGTNDLLSAHFAVPDGEFWDRITVRDLLCMGTGQAKCPLTEAMNAGLPLDDVEGLFFAEKIVHAPGKKFLYNNAATYMLSKLISRKTGMSLNDFLRPRIFEPLGIDNVRWEADSAGVSFGCSGLYLSAHELSRFGQLLLDEGMWEGQRLIPAEYIRAATSMQISTADFTAPFATADHKSGYGYQLWINSWPGTYRLDGLYGQYVVVFPEKDAVVTFVSNESERMVAILELTWDYIARGL